MKLERYGISLRSIRAEDLETVRTWRNSDLVRPYMFYQKIISQQDQKQWFSKLNPLNNFYFIISHNDVQIGVCNIRDIDWKKGCCEGGIFVGEEKFLNSSVPIRAVLTACEYWFNFLTVDQVSISILQGNGVAVKFNKMLGAKEVSNSDGLISMTLTRDGFNQETSVRRSQFDARYHQGNSELKITAESVADQSTIENCKREIDKSNKLSLIIDSVIEL
ncbi:GNAT family N-acetyltransferase [Flavobacteriales bacterium]|nr:GNAT family N-acetyltransferase [Flavobacteriales bacterium]